MSRYRATTGELLEQVRKEAKTKDIYHMAFAGDNVEAISKKLKLDVSTVKKILGERFSMSDFKANEKQNHHSENALELAKQFGTGKEIHDMKAIIKFVNQRGYINKQMFDIGARITKKYASKLEAYREVQEEILNEYNPNFGKDTNAGRTKETHASNIKTSGEDKVKSLENEIQRLKLELENEKNATVKPEPNPDTGEVPLTIGIAHKYIKDKADKKEVKKEEVEIDEATFSPAMITQLKKQYEPLRGKRIAPEPLMKIFDKIDSNKDALITLFKADIPFVSQLAVSRLISKHNMKGAEINKLREEVEVQEEEERTYTVIHVKHGKEVVKAKTSYDAAKKYAQMKNLKSTAGVESYLMTEEVELTEYFATVHSDKKPIVDFVKKYARTPSTQASIDYVDDDAGGNIEFEGKGAHDLADKVKAKFGVRVTKESFEPIENKSLEEMSLSSAERARGSDRPITIQYTYMRNPILFMQTLKGTKTGKKLKHVFPRKMGSDEYILKGTYQDHIDFLKTLNSKGIMPNNKIIGEELEEDTNKYITEKIKGLENKAKKTGMPYGILKKVYDRGMAAWKGGHRPGAGQQQWAFARVNSFVTKSSGTWGKADKDLAQKVRAAESVEESRQLKDKEKEMLVSLDGKVKVIDKSEWDKYKSKGYIQAEDKEEENEACWDSHKQVGTKMKGGKRVPNCVPKNEEVDEGYTPLGSGKLTPAQKRFQDVLKRATKDKESKKATYLKTKHNLFRLKKNEELEESLLDKNGKPSMGKLKSAIDDVNNTRSMAGDKYGITNIDYREKNGKKFLDVEVEDEKGLLNALRRKYGNKIKLRGYSDFYIEEVQEADLTDKQVDMVKKVADKLPKDDFKKRYGKDADNVKFGTATNIVKKKLNIDGYDGARNLVDRLLKKEKGDE